MSEHKPVVRRDTPDKKRDAALLASLKAEYETLNRSIGSKFDGADPATNPALQRRDILAREIESLGGKQAVKEAEAQK